MKTVEYWNAGIMEYWERNHHSTIPIFHFDGGVR